MGLLSDILGVACKDVPYFFVYDFPSKTMPKI